MNNPIIVELSDMNSVVALLTFVDEIKEGYEFVFSVVKTPPEDQINEYILNLGEILAIHLERSGHRVLGMLNTPDISDIWFKLISTIDGTTNIYSPCIGCNVLRHLVRIPIAKLYNTSHIMTGERKNQDLGVIKLNQNGVVLPLFDAYFANENIDFIRPLYDTLDNSYVIDTYNKFCAEYSIDNSLELFSKCILTNTLMEVNKQYNLHDYCNTMLFPYLDSIKESVINNFKKGES